MESCIFCSWLYSELGAGIVSVCGCEDLSEEDYIVYSKEGELGCPHFEKAKDYLN